MTPTEFEKKKAEVLRGGTIMNVFTDNEGEFWGLQVLCEGPLCVKKGVFGVWINQDPEGNGPGSIDIQEWKD